MTLQPKISKIEDVLKNIKTPTYLCEEALLEENLKYLNHIQKRYNIKILLAIKAFSNSSVMSLVRKYLKGCCASGLYEAKYGREFLKKEVHVYSPAFKDDEIDEICRTSDYIIFNSFNQLKRFKDNILPTNSIGLRINPEISFSPVEIYNPCGIYSRFGLTKKEFTLGITNEYLDQIDGFHFHALCEQNVEAFEDVLDHFESIFGKYFKYVKWVNFGGGLNLTQQNFDIEAFVTILNKFKNKYPHLEIYLEPGEAVAYQTGALIATVIDIIHNNIDIALLDVSAECHMPDTLLMPYTPTIRGANIIQLQDLQTYGTKDYIYRISGNTCLSGDIMGDYSFTKPLNIGDKIIFEDQIHYTTVKNTTFNGIKLPSLSILKSDGTIDVVKQFNYEDYKNRN
ncbi:Carboxynorspermidine decarboxylase, putative [hydrothermal vent metagenome]|uniref:Carboxynorspermidine decarboxylase, putative n=1 Tax=hydrothermal vent metagenome TaxID=652676 RepID=A0A3B1DS54_9ZZZZ